MNSRPYVAIRHTVLRPGPLPWLPPPDTGPVSLTGFLSPVWFCQGCKCNNWTKWPSVCSQNNKVNGISVWRDVARALSEKLQLCVNKFNCFEQQMRHYGLFLVKVLLTNTVNIYGDIAILLHCNLIGRSLSLKALSDIRQKNLNRH